MKRPNRIFAVSAGASAILFAAVLICADHAEIPLPGHSGAWELAFKDGRVRLENQPQIRQQAERYAAAVAEVEKESEEKEAPSRKILKQEPWGSAKYQEALQEFNRLRDLCTKRLEQLAAEQSAAAIRPVEYSLPLVQLLIALAILPLAWVVRNVVPWLRKPARPARGTRAARRMLSGAAAFSALLFIAVGILWWRGRFMEDRLVYNTRSPATLTIRSYSIWSLDGDIHLVRTEQVYAQRGAFDFENPINVANGLANSSWVPTRPGLGYASIKVVHTPQSLFGLLGIRFSKMPNSRHLFTPIFHYDRTSIPVLPGAASTFGWVKVSVPDWFLMLLLCIAPLLWIRRRRFALQNEHLILCHKCGYDLRASSERCPECGEAFSIEPVESVDCTAATPATAVPHSGQRSAEARKS